jgi:hypothetical protein
MEVLDLAVIMVVGAEDMEEDMVVVMAMLPQ